MSYITLTARISGQEMQLINQPLIASGSKGVLQVKCEFDATWAGYANVAVFYRTESEVFHVVLVDGVATVPHEVLREGGYFYFGIMGTAENIRTTEVLRLTVAQGAITIATATAETPTPNIYDQLLVNFNKLSTALSVERARIDLLVAMADSGVNPGITIPEVVDIRVGHDGRTFATAGAAVRDIGKAAAAAGLQLSAEGTEIQLHDAAGQGFRSFIIDGGGLMPGELVEITVSGRNLFNISRVNDNCKGEGTTLNMTTAGYQYDIFTGATGSNHAVSTENLDKLPILPAGSYTLSYRRLSDSGYVRVFRVAEDGTVTALNTETGDGPWTFSLPEASRITLRRSSNTAMTVEDLQIEPGDTAHAYEPHAGSQTVTVRLEGADTTAITTDVLAQHSGLITYKPTTIIRTTRNGGMSMRAEYYGDVKAYIDNKFAELATAVLSN